MPCSQEKEGPPEKRLQSPVQSEREAVLVGTIVHILSVVFFPFKLLLVTTRSPSVGCGRLTMLQVFRKLYPQRQLVSAGF